MLNSRTVKIVLIVLLLHGLLLYALQSGLAQRLVDHIAPVIMVAPTPIVTPEKMPEPEKPKPIILKRNAPPEPSKPVVEPSKPLPKSEAKAEKPKQEAPKQEAPKTSAPNESVLTSNAGTRTTTANTNSATSNPPQAEKPAAPKKTGPKTISIDQGQCDVIPQPDYPESAKQNGDEGTAMVRVYIDSSGHVTKTELAKSSKFGRLDQAAQSAAKRIRCKPDLDDKESVRIGVQPYIFKLE